MVPRCLVHLVCLSAIANKLIQLWTWQVVIAESMIVLWLIFDVSAGSVECELDCLKVAFQGYLNAKNTALSWFTL